MRGDRSDVRSHDQIRWMRWVKFTAEESSQFPPWYLALWFFSSCSLKLQLIQTLLLRQNPTVLLDRYRDIPYVPSRSPV
jgi:hypothetical protein